MKIIVGIVLGFFSGFLFYMATALLIAKGEPTPAFVLTSLLGGWVLSSVVLIRGARSVSKVFSRGFLLGAAEWLAMVPVGVVYSGMILSESLPEGAGSAEVAGATLGAGFISILTGGVSIAMALICLTGFAISFFIGREMKPEAARPTKLCPDCAELIQAAARKCKHCSADLSQS